MNNQNIENLEDEISLLEIVDFFRESWKKILVSGIVGGALGVGYALISPSIYEATANIQVAKVAGSDVETPSALVEKLKMPMYYTQSTFTACNLMERTEPGEAIAKKLNPTLSKNAPIIRITYKEKSTEDAKKCLEGVISDIRTNQNILAKPILETRNNQLDNLKQKLEFAERTSKILSTKNQNFDFSDSKFLASELLLVTTLNKENQIKDLRTQIIDLEISLAEPQTKETFLTTAIYAPSTRVEPNRSRIILLGGIVGGVLAIAYLLGRRVWLKINIPNKAI
jgi:LPS O-antigen subunit length determinant protein (WzzB/FepE family)